MSEELDELIQRVKEKHLGESTAQKHSKRGKLAKWRARAGERIGDVLVAHKKLVIIGILVVGAVLFGVVVLTEDYLTKRQNYPERNVLFRSTSVVYIAGGSEEKGAKDVDQLIETEVYEGGVESKVGTIFFTTQREIRDDIEYFNVYNTKEMRVASATRKPEIVQAGLRIGGSLNFKEQLAEIIVSDDAKAPQSYHVYKFVPERGSREVEVTIVEEPDGTTRLDNRMIERRAFLLGWRYGKEFRAGTFLEAYRPKPENEQRAQQFQEYIRILDSQQTSDRATREQMIKEAMQLGEAIETSPVYMTYEDGFFDLLPQESTIFLAHKPSWFQRVRDAFLGTSPNIRLRVENSWDLFPGRYPFLRKIRIGKGENAVYPFDKYNNGGYTIKDRYGNLARIEIQDFILFYGQDLLYSYYFDLNGDGRLDKDMELIGTVLCRTTHDERLDLEKLVGEGKPKTDVTFTMQYSFMSPVPELEPGMDYFKLCGYIESMMPDQVNRGFGKHSLLGYINEQRSDIMLFTNLSVENMSRALTQESTLVAKYDIVKALIAAKRPYAQQAAEAFGIADQFDGAYEMSENLKARRDWSQITGAILLLGMLVAIVWMRWPRKEPASQTS
jgi:hypothetical protein